ncbi:TIGR04283 family arsenosugar biosynthesis glycosyltransferase [Thiolapillus sp.]|uniref:TIGR04283 family arsenosugar biosynthesis glycosyltransferase n=1 Tax=Thiolapillus sp. TaxID=2017437 RepID=UPI0025E0FE6E|nr:TIGR04283 family arsenosugar biosynthesis glycosyltransferase [Thiolapillus sp.]
MISVIIPCLNEAANIQATLTGLQPLRCRGHEIIVVDGGSNDDTIALASPLADKVLLSAKGRARQMNAGAQAANGDVLWFVHADTRVMPDADRLILQALQRQSAAWGRFDVRLSGSRLLLRMVEKAMNLRSRLSGIATGDQGIFVRAGAFQHIGGYAEIPLMEDIDLSRRLKKTAGNPLCLTGKLLTSSRRWETWGIVKTILLMWRLRLRYALGADPAELARLYR